MSRKWQEGHGQRVTESFRVTLPTLLCFMVLILLLQQQQARAGLVCTLSLLACVAPLLLNVIAFDTERFACMAIINSFLVLLWCLDSDHQQVPSASASMPSMNILTPIAILLIAFNIFSDIRFVSGLSPSTYPFANHRALLHTLFDDAKQVPIPYH